jgi:hypothetical protein
MSAQGIAGETMPNSLRPSTLRFAPGLLASLVLFAAGCATAPQGAAVKRIKAGQEQAGFLKDYSKLAPNPNLEGDVKTFVQAGADKNLRRYIAVIVEPVDVYLASDADDAKLPEDTRAAVANYFRAALTQAVSDAFPVVDQPGPLVLRLRAAVIGVDAGGPAAEGLPHAANISKVGVEVELLDSVSGDQIAAMVDREPLGQGAEVASVRGANHEKSVAARHAFDEWARRVRIFLNRAHELTGEDAARAQQSYLPFSEAPAK